MAERYVLTKACAIGLSAVVAAYGFLGWLYVGDLFKAVLCLLAQAVAINATIAARRAFDKEIPLTGIIGVLFAAAAAGFSEQGLHHAWTAGLHIEQVWPLKLALSEGSEISPVLTWALCIIEPGLFWFAERVEMTVKPKTAEDLANEALFDLRGDNNKGENNNRRKTEQERDGLAPPPRRPREIAPARGQNNQNKIQAPIQITRNDPTAGRRGKLGRGDRAAAFEMIDAGATAGAAHRATGVPLSTCKDYAKNRSSRAQNKSRAQAQDQIGDGLRFAA